MDLKDINSRYIMPVLVFGRPWPGLSQVELRTGFYDVFLYGEHIGQAENGLQVYLDYLFRRDNFIHTYEEKQRRAMVASLQERIKC